MYRVVKQSKFYKWETVIKTCANNEKQDVSIVLDDLFQLSIVFYDDEYPYVSGFHGVYLFHTPKAVMPA